MEIKVLGKGCKKCNLLEQHAKQAVKSLGIEASVEKVTDINDIAEYGVMKTPALVVDGEVVVAGKVPKASQLKEMFKK